MEIARELLDQIVAHALREAPNECCGVVAVEPAADGQPARARKVRPAVNLHKSPKRFEIDGREVLAATNEFDAAGWEVGAIYHSHTHTAPYPSQTDVNFARNWPGVEWIIVGLADPDAPEVRSYEIEEGQVREVALAPAAVA
jgi:[CysO sulfur-carrier protein]-S-L-cysteine hydrolase